MRHSYLRVAHTDGRKVNVVALKGVLYYANSINWFCALPTERRICRIETDGRKFADDLLCVDDNKQLTFF
jgi:hypothetical protein